MDTNVIKQLVISFLDTKIKDLNTAVKNNDYEKIIGMGHNIKGNSGTVALGFSQCNELGKKIEQMAKDKVSMDQIATEIKKLEAEYKKIK